MVADLPVEPVVDDEVGEVARCAILRVAAGLRVLLVHPGVDCQQLGALLVGENVFDDGELPRGRV